MDAKRTALAPQPAEPEEAVLRRRIEALERLNAELIHRLECQEEVNRARRTTDELYRQLAENIREVFWITSADKSRLLYVSPAYEQIFGRPVEEAYRQPTSFLDAIHPEDRERVRANLPRQKLHETEIEYRVVGSTGEIRHIWARTVPLKDASGEVYRICGISEDITHRVRIDEQRAASQRLLELVASNAPVMLFCVDRHGKVTFCDGKVFANLGVAAGQFVGQNVYEWLRERPDILAQLDRALAGESLDMLVEYGELVFETRYSPVPGPRGLIESVIVVCLDVTARHQAQQALQAERQRLQEMLEAHERDRKLIAYEIHDGLLQQVTGAKMHLEGLAAHNQSWAEEDRRQLDFLLKLLRSTLAEGRRLISGLRPPILDERGIIPALHYLVEEMHAAGSCPIELVENVVFNRLDPLQEGVIYRIVQEALTNVLRHSQAPAARVELAQQHDQLSIEIRDGGVGFDPARVIERRYGLAGIRERARLLGGHAEITSQPGQGTRVAVTLPVGSEASAPVVQGAQR